MIAKAVAALIIFVVILTASRIGRMLFSQMGISFYRRYGFKQDHDGVTHLIHRLPSVLQSADWTFRRNDFIRECLSNLSGAHFKINVDNTVATILTGQKAAVKFFNVRQLSLEQGYKMMQPEKSDWRTVKGMPGTSDSAAPTWFISRFKQVYNVDTLVKRNLALVHDIDEAFSRMGHDGIIEPFDAMYTLVLKLLLRIGLPDELVDQNRMLSNIAALFSTVDHGHHLWLPGWSNALKVYYGFQVYRKFDHMVRTWKRNQRENGEAIQSMLDRGDKTTDIISFMLGASYAGLVNTSRLVAWTLVYFTTHPQWKRRVVDEMRTMLIKHGASSTSMDRIPAHAWCSSAELPSLDLVGKEIIRCMGVGTLLRCNVGNDVNIDGCTVPSGGMIVLPMFNIHHNPEFYGPDACEFNPSHVEQIADDGTIRFVGWGVGLHPCTGRHMAQAIHRLVLTHLLMRYDCNIVDQSGSHLTAPPARDMNSLHLPETVKPVFMKYRAMDGSEVE